MLRRIHDPEHGSSALEYIGVIVIAAAIVASIANIALNSRVSDGVGDAVADILNPWDASSPDDEEGPSDESGGSGGSPNSSNPEEDGGSNSSRNKGDQGGTPNGPSTAPLGLNASMPGLPKMVPSSNQVKDTADKAAKWGFNQYKGYMGAQYEDLKGKMKTAKSAGSWGADRLWGMTFGDRKETSLKLYNDVKSLGKKGKDTFTAMYNDTKQDAFETSARAVDRWRNGNKAGAVAGLGADNVRFFLWDSPMSPGRRTVDDEARKNWSEGNYGAALAGSHANMRDQALAALPFGPKIPKIPKMPKAPKTPKGKTPDKDKEHLADGGKKDKDKPDKGKGCNSFVPGTPVLLADGTTEPIEDVRAGEKVLATDPTTGESGARTVTDHINGYGTKTLVTLAITADDGTTDTITATDEHPFWAPQLHQWVDAIDLQPGTWLQTSSGTWVQVQQVDARTARQQTAHNLTVNGLHTYYVAAEREKLLVHNDLPDGCNLTSESDSPKFESHTVTNGKFKGGTYRLDVENSHPGKSGSNIHIQLKGRGYDDKSADKYFLNPNENTWTNEDGKKIPKKVEKNIQKKDVNRALKYLGLDEQ